MYGERILMEGFSQLIRSNKYLTFNHVTLVVVRARDDPDTVVGEPEEDREWENDGCPQDRYQARPRLLTQLDLVILHSI